MNILNKSILNELEAHITHDKFVRNIRTFMAFLPVQIGELEAMLHTSDIKSLGEKAHMLKGTCGQFGAMRLHEIFKTIEMYARQDRMKDLTSLVQVLPYEYQLVEELISLSYLHATAPQQGSRYGTEGS